MAVRWPAVAAIAGGTALIGLHGWSYGNWINDDAAITFAYARDLVDGFGPVLQPGAEPVEGFSNPAWLVLLVLGKVLGLFDTGAVFGMPDYVLFPKALGLLCCAGILAACQFAASRVTRWAWLVTAFAGALLAAIPSFVIWCLSGLENPLYALVVAWLAALLFRAAADGRVHGVRVALVAGLLAAVAALTRPDGAVFVLAYPLVALMFLRRVRGLVPAGLSVLAFAVPYGGYLLWRYAEFGRWVPNTAVAKNQQAPSLENLARVAEPVEYLGWPVVLAGLATVVLAFVLVPALRRPLLGWLVPLVLALAAYCVLNPEPGGEFRFATPLWTMVALVAALCAVEVMRALSARWRAVLAVVLVAAAVPSAPALAESGRGFASGPVVPLCQITERYGRLFNGYADVIGVRDGSVLLPDVGGTALTSRLRVVDSVGLVDARIADLVSAGDFRGLRDHVFDEVRPTFIHTHVPWSELTGITADPRLALEYAAVVLDRTGHNGDWVRLDALDGSDLERVRAYARKTVPAIEVERANEVTGECGPVLRPGQVP
ncbi:hypothetical protein GCM10027445_39730 [Amycolatopsis endophytica]|uniref:Glycosyltransferase RgtA/B/C/D-like domain-containing protein n=1 Tax=Amycolatopsis endophytica TaxID=860233 RepID=A0A853B0F3_9PSEU|nr:hypothetical protein [Amycolatopsis endophytica]NYI88337.1 hypothetical protein [Amycolatopsis endophytica]